jgi:hypothetical protein
MKGRAVATLAGALLLVGASAGLAAAPRRAARMLVYAQEWSLWPSRTTLPRGPVLVELWNRGQDAHDLRLRRLDRHGHMIGHAQALGVTDSGALGHARWRLRPGRYELYCSMPGHYALGMHTVITVR